MVTGDTKPSYLCSMSIHMGKGDLLLGPQKRSGHKHVIRCDARTSGMHRNGLTELLLTLPCCLNSSFFSTRPLLRP